MHFSQGPRISHKPGENEKPYWWQCPCAGLPFHSKGLPNRIFLFSSCFRQAWFCDYRTDPCHSKPSLTKPPFPIFRFFLFSHANCPDVPHFPLFCLHFLLFSCVLQHEGFIRMFRILYGLNIENIGIFAKGIFEGAKALRNPPSHTGQCKSASWWPLLSRRALTCERGIPGRFSTGKEKTLYLPKSPLAKFPLAQRTM